mgnify:CR=1 FL=1
MIANADSVYPEVLADARRQVPGFDDHPLADRTAAVLARGHGCWDSWGAAFTAHGVAATEHVIDLDPDLVGVPDHADTLIIHNIGRFTPAQLVALRTRFACLIGHFSHAAPSDDHLRAFDLCVTAFPHYARDYAARGFPIRYLPLAFDPRRLGLDAMGRGRFGDATHADLFLAGDVAKLWDARKVPVSFVGGLGHPHIWAAGQSAISSVAERVPGFAWWGYAGPALTDGLRHTHRGPAWGHVYFARLGDSRLTLNRHGEVHAGHACNMRLFEATGMGACLLTEAAPNLGTLLAPWEECVPFGDPNELVTNVRQLLAQPALAAQIAAAGQRRTLKDHTYARRAEVLLEWIRDVRR